MRLLSSSLFIFLCCSTLLYSCKTTKNSTKNEIQTVLLDTLEIIRSKDDLYKASETKVHDMQHIRLQVKFDWQNQFLFGKAYITLKPHFYSSNEVILDAKGMDIKSVQLSSGKALSYTYDTAQLTISLDKEYNRSESYTIIIDYIAKPEERAHGGSRAISSDKGLYFINPLNKERNKPQQIWTQGETESSSGWFPCIDKPNQKMTQEIEITVEKKYSTLSNGLLTKSVQNADGTRTDFWQMNQAHAPYLAMMAIGEYAVLKDQWKGKEVSYYVEPAYKDMAKQIFGNTPEMMEFYSNRLGVQFPWPKYAQVIVRDYVSGAMENTSATIHGEFVQRTARQLIDESHQDIIAHELFHQWFGDLVTCESWSNLPINESFATYGEYLWNEFKYGRLYADWKQQRQLKGYFSESKRKNVDLIRFYYDDKEDMFDAHSYNKGGGILHMLRNVVGDDAFFSSLQLYLTKNAYGTAEVHNLRLAFEEVTGKDMNKFFNQWFLQSGHPILDIKYRSDEDSVYVDIVQKHNTEDGKVYNLPMKINVFYGDVIMTYPVVLKYATQHFSFAALGNPNLIDVDTDRALLCEKKENKTLQEYAFQLDHTALFAARSEALDGLKPSVCKNEIATNAFLKVMDDKEWIWRKEAIKKLRSDSLTQTQFLEKVKNLATSDPSAAVRSEALIYLVATNRKDLQSVFETALNDSSYRCMTQALEGLYITDSIRATKKAIGYLSEPDGELKNISYTILSKNKELATDTLLRKKLDVETGYIKYALYYHYANYLCNADSATIVDGLQFLFSKYNENAQKDNAQLFSRVIKRVDDYVQKREVPFKEAIKTLAADLQSKLKTESK